MQALLVITILSSLSASYLYLTQRRHSRNCRHALRDSEFRRRGLEQEKDLLVMVVADKSHEARMAVSRAIVAEHHLFLARADLKTLTNKPSETAPN